MSDLISRQAAIESIRECAEAAHDNHEWDTEQGYLNAIECIEEEPSAQPTVDAVPVIRCKDCKYFKRRSIYHHGLCDVHCNGIGEEEVTSEDQFCSWAERKEE